ncbi:hypothetical protein ACFFRR_002742 [Megaselia abdita]
MNFYNLVATISLLLHYSQCNDVAVSVSGMEKMVTIEQNLIKTLQAYVEDNEMRVLVIKMKIKEFKEEHNKGLKNVEKYVSNPISSFSLMRRLVFEYNDVLQLIKNSTVQDTINQIEDNMKMENYPNSEDVSEATEGFIKLQSTYKLKPSEIVKGVINGVKYPYRLHSKDLFDIGLYAFSQGHHFYADEWFKASLEQHMMEGGQLLFYNFDKEIILGKAIDNKIAQLDFIQAKEYAFQLIELNKQSSKALETLDKINGFLALNTTPVPSFMFQEPHGSLDDVITGIGCRGEFSKMKRLSPDLTCFYEKKNHPFLKLAPIKVEIINLENPYIIIFHEVISEKEIEVIKNLSKPGLTRAGVCYNDEKATCSLDEKSSHESRSNRKSKLVWLDEKDHEIFSILTQRSEDMTGLSLSTSEEFQVANYGLGGHFAQHKDYFGLPENVEDLDYKTNGNRFATMLFYLSDVEQGGLTIFPQAVIAVKPKKGSCVFWYNMLPNGEGNPKTIHAGCPVLVGNKWVINKWIRANGQMFTKPCPAGYQ